MKLKLHCSKPYCKMATKQSTLENRLVKGLSVLFGANLILVLGGFLCVRMPENDVIEIDLSRCNASQWAQNDTTSIKKFEALVHEISKEELKKPQIHYLGWSELLDPDSGIDRINRPKYEKAHFTGCFRCTLNTEKTTAFDKLCWNYPSPFSFRNTTYSEGRIRVTRPGYYFIYSRILFDITKLNTQWMCLTHDMIRESKDNILPIERLLENRHVLTKPGDNISSYLGAVFYLYSGESIYVRVNQQSHQFLLGQDSYFGLFSL